MLDSGRVFHEIGRLSGEWPQILGDDAVILLGWVRETAQEDDEAVRVTVRRALTLLQDHPAGRERLAQALGYSDRLQNVIRILYERPPGEEDHVEVGTLMVCPEDPSHYQRRLRQKGQRLFCPEHNKALVPADSLPEVE